jgi:HD-like signal output (HDOD) protein
LASKANKELESWIKKLSEQDMPVFSSTVADVTESVNNEDSSASEVAQTILRDASLTSRLLKVANTFNYCPMGRKISTVSRAIMVMGFEQVGVLTLTLALVESLSGGIQRDKLTEEMAQSFHAAIQAQELAKKTECKSPEDIFVATLLSRLGNMAFWAFSDQESTEVLNLIQSENLTEQEAELQVLGFRLRDLTESLSKSWTLGDLLDDFLSGAHDDDERVNMISVGQELAEAAKNGWDSDEVSIIFDQTAEKLDLSVDEVKVLAYQNAKYAKELTHIYGVTEASKRIPQPHVDTGMIEEDFADIESESTDEPRSTIIEDTVIAVTGKYPEPDSNVQLTIMQEITFAIEEKPNINIVLEMVLEGLHRGVGMDRALFAIISHKKKILTCKYALGEKSDRLCKELRIDLSNDKNIFHQVIENKKAIHVPSDPKKLTGTLSRDTLKLLGPPAYLIMPVIIRSKVIGIFMADRNASGRDVEEKDFIAFQQFCQQANMGLSFLTM